MKRNMRLPTVNFRMAVMDLCELTGYTEREMLDNLYEHLNRFFTDHPKRKRQNWPIYFESDKYRIPHTRALTFIWAIKEREWKWNHPVEIDEHDHPVPEAKAVAFEDFYVRLPDMCLFLSLLLDSDDLEELRQKWKYSVMPEPTLSAGRELQKIETKSRKEKIQVDANLLAGELYRAGKKFNKDTIARELLKRDEYRQMTSGTLLRQFHLPKFFR